MKQRRYWTISAVLFFLLLLGIGRIGMRWQQGYSPDSIQNILLISIDTCRADHFGCYGDPRAITPNLDRLAAESISFENVIAPVPLTLPSHCSMLTGTNPVYHGVHDNLDYELGNEHVTLAEILRDQGFTTGGLVSAFVLDSRFGLAQGFDSWDDQFEEERLVGNMSERVGGEAARRAIRWLQDHRQERCFYFLHFYDPHHKYEPPEP
ncbi:MAG: sulfatase-like hydrolase/transferase, partial [Bythopirellula sp.]